MENNETFEYSYSAEEHEELRKIREKYLPKGQTKMDRIRELDESVEKKATVISMIIGILGIPFFGIGLACTTKGTGDIFVIGVIAGVLGLILMALACPVYKYVVKKQREKIAPIILKLTDELSESEE